MQSNQKLVTLFYIILFALSFETYAQNKKPKIDGQREVTIEEDATYTIAFLDLIVRDDDDWFYPFGFTLQVYDGTDYTRTGNSIRPLPNFSGSLRIPVTVNDGEDFSSTFLFLITVTPVNDKPIIRQQTGPIVVKELTPLAIELKHVEVEDPDDQFPDDFAIQVLSQSNAQYTTFGNVITPKVGSRGTIAVSVKVNDGAADSEPFNLNVTVEAGNAQPVIVGNTPFSISEDSKLTFSLNAFTVQDPDNRFPEDFSLQIEESAQYSFDGLVLTPRENFFGDLVVGITVSDGVNRSAVYRFPVRVTAVNDAPLISDIEKETLPYDLDQGPVNITQTVQIVEVEQEPIAFAEIGFLSGQYRFGNDELSFTNTAGVTGSFNTSTGVLLLSGSASAEVYTNAIRSVRYNYVTIVEAVEENKTVFIRVSDGTATSEVTRIIQSEPFVAELDIPKAFTPNGDSANDTWVITPLVSAEESVSPTVRVYSKHGTLVFEANGFTERWDGTFRGDRLPADVYYFTIDYQRKLSKPIKGTVVLLR